jgi:hypothetical protein
MKTMAIALCAALIIAPTTAHSHTLQKGGCSKAYKAYRGMKGHKAFTLGRVYHTTGRWTQACGWADGYPSQKSAIERALQECRNNAKQKPVIPKPDCQVYRSE